MTMLQQVLRHLDALVSFDTRNPPRHIGTGGIFDYIRAQLPGFRIDVTDHGDGAVSLLAVRGTPRRVFNVHLDTVPSSEAWASDPFALKVTDDRAIGLGACDIKGAAAGLIAAANATPGDAAFLFSSDEEANDPRCIAGGSIGRGDQSCRRTLDVAGAKPDRTLVLDPRDERIGAPRRRRGHRVQVHVEHPRGPAAHRQQRDRPVAMVLQRAPESRQLRLDVLEDPRPDRPRRIARVEGNELLQMPEHTR